ncbi:energy transducer TonB [Kordiimonas marina]|uniref:energy transducer TonB n=1 Tax=Kordiimonas marina TaxID=2872312 RepID=UPI001FF20D61|nr:TonB family protein [Kordiimonas marina]MCJ9428076.1 TonB family protein [Kordiimonas marina]
MTIAPFIKTLTAAALLSVSLAGTAYAGAADMKAWRISVVKEIAKKQRYPRAAQVREIEGTAKVKIVVAADGTIKSSEVLQPTGKDVLDQEIPKLLKRLTLPALPAGESEMSLVLPLSWTLR